MNCNFTNDKLYRFSLYYRFFGKDIKTLDNLDLIKYYDGLTCFQYFDCNITDNDINDLKKINKRNRISFRYINKDSVLFNSINKKFKVEICDEWKAPIIRIKKGEYIRYIESRSYNFRRMIKKCNQIKKEIKIVSSNSSNINELLKDVLIIDQNSWKYEEKSDMMNLKNEQIIYLSLLKYCKITVAYYNNKPIGYSLLLRYNHIYYAAKWGTTEIGRTMNAGIISLLEQIKSILKKEDLIIDLWGRRNKIYDRLATDTIDRVYFDIIKNGYKGS